MQSIELVIQNQSVKYLCYLIDWSNDRIGTRYELVNQSLEGHFAVLSLINFDDNYRQLFNIGVNYGRWLYREKLPTERAFIASENKESTVEFEIISEDDKLIIEVIRTVNKELGTDFMVREFLYDEVIFATVYGTAINCSDIFYLGCRFGIEAQVKKEKGELDW